MKSINTLIPDIYALMEKDDGWFTEELAGTLSADISLRLRASLNQDRRERPTLRLSRMGPSCPRALWYSIHKPELAEPLPPWAKIKYTYGHILEALVIALAKAAGHSVVGEQDAVYVDGIPGHRDAVIDGHVVDVKSCSSRAFEKLKSKRIVQDDSFGHLDQLDGYLVGSSTDPLVTSDVGYLLGIDKVLGHMILYEHKVREYSIHQRIAEAKRIVASPTPPACQCGTRPSGKSGNIELDVKASYSAYKHSCHPGLRTFLYASGPVYLTKVVRKPDVTEINREGKIVYH